VRVCVTVDCGKVILSHGSIAAGDALDPPLWKAPNKALSLACERDHVLGHKSAFVADDDE
jgi:hypothetical protein